MNIQDYKNQIAEDVLQFAKDNKGCFDSLDSFEDAAFVSDSVTGNASGSYTFNTCQAEENIKDLIFSDELLKMYQEYGYDRIPLEEGAEAIDVAIRCFLLSEVIAENEEEIKENLNID